MRPETRRLELGVAPDVDGLAHDRILDDDGRPYLERYHLVQTRDRCVRFHRWIGSDDQRALHDHPYGSSSLVLAGTLIEHTDDGDQLLETGTLVVRDSTTPHALELVTLEAWTLFSTGPVRRRWGFHTADGWQHWTEYPHAGRYDYSTP